MNICDGGTTCGGATEGEIIGGYLVTVYKGGLVAGIVLYDRAIGDGAKSPNGSSKEEGGSALEIRNWEMLDKCPSEESWAGGGAGGADSVMAGICAF